MIDSALQQLDTLLIYVFAVSSLAGAVLMLLLQQPMRVALALIWTMVSLSGIYGLLGVHFIAAFQVLIYVGAVMLFMVYVIMLLEVREANAARRFSRLLVPGIAAGALLIWAIGYGVWQAQPLQPAPAAAPFGLQQFSVAFLGEYWLHFELTSVLLVVAVVAAIAVIKVARKNRG